MGYSPWGGKELDLTEQLSTEQTTCFQIIVCNLVVGFHPDIVDYDDNINHLL